MRSTILTLAILLCGCSLDVNRTGTAFECDPGGTCPDGYSCIDNICVRNSAPGCSEAVTAGGEHSCALRNDGTVWCWGNNSNGQIGDDGAIDRVEPAQVADLTDVRSVDAGDLFTCAVDAAGAWCWGHNNVGQLGDGSTSPSRRPIAVRNLTGPTAVAAGGAHACAIAGGVASCWGNNGSGQLGDTTSSSRGTPAPVTGLPPVKAISAGGQHTCAIDMGGQLYCWGSNNSGQLGLGTTSTTPVTSPQLVPELTGVTAVAAGGSFTCAISDRGPMCFGNNGSGALGNGETASSASPVLAAMPVFAVSITAGADHACARDTDGGLWCWGNNSATQLGDGTSAPRKFPLRTGFVGVTDASAGNSHTCVLFEEGGISCAGSDSRGQLGAGKQILVPTPKIVEGLEGAISISAGSAHTCVGLSSGTAKCWGQNFEGQIGDGSFTLRTRPSEVVGLANIEQIAGGSDHTCAMLDDGSVWCWGYNGEGQLGIGTNVGAAFPRVAQVGGPATSLEASSASTCAMVNGVPKCWGRLSGSLPVDVANGLGGLRALARGNNHTCAIQADQNVVCWGLNGSGQLGNGTQVDPPLPTDLISTGITEAEQVYAEGNASCAIRRDGTAWCWGFNSSNWLGAQNYIPTQAMPTPVFGLTNAVQIAMRSSQQGICARKSDGTVACWGQNNEGQVGDGTVGQHRQTAVTVPGLTDVVDLAVGVSHTCAVKSDGTVACWGSAASGQLGDGVRTTFLPVNARMTCE